MRQAVLPHLGLDVLVGHPDGPVDEAQVVRPVLETRSPDIWKSRILYLKFVIMHVSQIQPEILLEVLLEHPRRDVAAGLPAVHGEGAVVGPLHVAQELDGSLQQKGHK